MDGLEGIWEVLSGKLPSGEKLTARIIPSDTEQSMYCALDSNEKRHLLVSLGEEEMELKDKSSRGISVNIRELFLGQKDEMQRYIDIQCQNPSGHSIFDLLIADIAEVMHKDKLPVSKLIPRTLEKWRRFWEKIPTRTLTREKQIGLFAELRFLSKWLIPVLGLENAVNSWLGPFGGKDFRTESFSVEVKSSASGKGHIYLINSLDQLEESPEREMYLFGLLLSEVSGGRENIVKEVESIREIIAGCQELSDHFEDGLIRVGYGDFHSEEYKNLCFEIGRECLFEVRDDFPRLSRSRIEIPPGVDSVEYTINLNSFNHLIKAESPSEWNP